MFVFVKSNLDEGFIYKNFFFQNIIGQTSQKIFYNPGLILRKFTFKYNEQFNPPLLVRYVSINILYVTH